MKGRFNNLSIESFLVMTLLIIFAIAMSTVILRGSQSYERLLANKEQEENARIAYAYVNMMIKKNDRTGAVSFRENGVEGIESLVIQHDKNESGYSTYIFYDDGYLKSCYTNEVPSVGLSESIVPLEMLDITLEDKIVTVEVGYLKGDELLYYTGYISKKSDGIR